MKIYLLDDSRSDLVILESFLKKYIEEMGTKSLEVEVFSSPKAFFAAFESAEEKPYLVFMDILMGTEDGIDIAKRLRDMGSKVRLIFATSSEDYMMEAFEVYADGYLKKPFTYENFKRAMGRLEERFIDESKTIKVKTGRNETEVPLGGIYSIESCNHSILITTGEGEIKSQVTLGEIWEMVKNEKSFIQVGRSFVVNMFHVNEVTREEILLGNGTSVLIPVRIRKQIQDAFAEFKKE